MEIPKLSLLTKEQVYGYNKLKLFDVIDPRAAVTDTAILRGAYVSNYYHVDGDDTLSGRTGYYWLQNSDGGGDVCVVDGTGTRNYLCCRRRDGSVRAALSASFIKQNAANIVQGIDGLERAQFGYYVGSAVNAQMQKSLEEAYNLGNLTNLGVGCTFDSRKYDDSDKNFLPEKQIYYGFNGKIYARIKANSNSTYVNEFTLSNSQKYVNKDNVWVNVEPVIWVRHPKDDVFINEKGFISGIRFYSEWYVYNGIFNVTELKRFLDNHLSKDLVNPIVYIYLNNYKKNEETINNIIYKDRDGKTIKKVKIKVRAKRNES